MIQNSTIVKEFCRLTLCLKIAAEFGSINCLMYLLRLPNMRANPMERNMTNNWVPLHEAASRNNFTCVNVSTCNGWTFDSTLMNESKN